MCVFTKTVVGDTMVARLEGADWSARNGAEIAPGEPAVDRYVAKRD